MKKKLFLTCALVLTLCVSVLPVNAKTEHGTGVEVTEERQVVDSFTFKGVTVNSYYSPQSDYKNQSEYMAKTGLACTELVNRFYKEVYGNKLSEYVFVKTDTPVAGDKAVWPWHQAIVRSVKDGWVTFFEQNYWRTFNQDSEYIDYALKGRRSTIGDDGVVYYHLVKKSEVAKATATASASIKESTTTPQSKTETKQTTDNTSTQETSTKTTTTQTTEKQKTEQTTKTTTSPTTTTKVSSDPVTQFVTRLYNLCFNRNPDTQGLNHWVTNLKSGKNSAAGVVSAFFLSTEMNNLKLNNSEIINRCYKVMMNRNADAGGKKMWVSVLDSGMGLGVVLKGFIDSSEFNSICNKYGVRKGQIILNEPREMNQGITGFVARCYKNVLSRDYDVNGINYWCNRILKSSNRKQAAIDTASNGFFHSKEFLSKNYNDTEYVKILYRTFLGREYDAGGLQYWLNQMKNGKSRDDVLEGFAYSIEFSSIMAKYGIK